MNWKEFFRPTILKLILFVVLFTFFTFLPTGFIKGIVDITSIFKTQINYLGLPLNFYKIGLCLATQDIPTSYSGCSHEFNFIYLLFDMIFWYVISALILTLLIKKPNQQ